ncbi:MAG: ABC transporter permease [Clostridiales bacterium]|nr:ABC transporter permease [Clostridiales bacterium]
MSIWVSISQFLAECNDNYTTVGLFEYMGPEYPDDYIFDREMNSSIDEFDFLLITENENVLLWDRSARALGYIEGFERKDTYAPYRKSGVILVNDLGHWNYYGTDSLVIKETLYSSVDYTDKLVLIEPFEFEFEDGHSYLLNGEFVYGRTSYPYFRPKPFYNQTAAKAGYNDAEDYIIEDITSSDGGYFVGNDNAFSMIADTYQVVNNSLSIFGTRNLEAMLPFHQQKMYIQDGRTFTEAEYTAKGRVCVITDLIAKSCDLQVGDSVTIYMAIKEDTPVNETYWAGTGFEYEYEYRIVGITNSYPETISHVYIPYDESLKLPVNQIGYTFGSVLLDNDGADDFYNTVSPQLPDRVRLTIYDQGYSSIVGPFKKILRIAIIITMTCLLVGIAVILLFGFLFVYRQRETADTMIKLGTGRWNTFMYFIYGSGIISFVASIFGVTVGIFLSDTLVNLVHENAENFIVSDKRYSISRLSISQVTEWVSKLEPDVFIWTGVCIFIATVLCCLAFTVYTLKKKNKKRRKKHVRKRKGHSLSFIGGPFKYSILSILRGNQRSVITPIVAIAIVIFLSQLAHTVDRYNKQLEDISSSSVIDLQFTDINGRYYDGLTVEAYQLNSINQSKLVKELSMTKSMVYRYLGRSVIDGQEQELEHLIFPQGFSAATFMDKLLRGPDIIFTNSISKSPEFYFSNSVDTEYFDGYDESFLGAEKSDISMCMVSTNFMEENGIELGDTIRIYIHHKGNFETDIVYEHKWRGAEIDARVVGSYVKAGEKDNIYCQLSAYYDTVLLEDSSDETKEINFDYVMDSANFKVDAAKLEEMKVYLNDFGFSEVNNIGMIRTFLICDDKAYNSTVDSLNQKIMHTNTLYPFLYVLVGIVALLLAYLLAVSRKKEIALMMGLGSPKISIFLSFFLEQIVLSTIGCVIGLAGWRIFTGQLIIRQLLLTFGFLTCYYIGSAVALIIMNNSVVMSILRDEE